MVQCFPNAITFDKSDIFSNDAMHPVWRELENSNTVVKKSLGSREQVLAEIKKI